MKKSIILITLVSLVLAITLSLSSCKKAGDDAGKTDSTEHPKGEHENPTGDK